MRGRTILLIAAVVGTAVVSVQMAALRAIRGATVWLWNAGWWGRGIVIGVCTLYVVGFAQIVGERLRQNSPEVYSAWADLLGRGGGWVVGVLSAQAGGVTVTQLALGLSGVVYGMALGGTIKKGWNDAKRRLQGGVSCSDGYPAVKDVLQ